MKIILREHVEHLGDRGDEVNVAAGYARNFLLPKGLAYRSGAGSAKQISDQRRAWAIREERSQKGAEALAAKLSALDLSVRRRAGDRGTLYGSVTNSDIAELIVASGFQIERRKIQLKEPIKALGTFDLVIKLHRDVTATVSLVVLTEAGQSLAQIEANRAALEPAVTPRSQADDRDDDGDDRDDRDEPRADTEQAGEA
jgi:large subunit ribosomal protein L9